MPSTTMRRLVGTSFALITIVLPIVGCAHDDRPTTMWTANVSGDALAKTSTGMVRGAVGPGYRLFAGIPYAAPPIGPLRFHPPAPAQPWTDVRDASHSGPRCVQQAGGPESVKGTDEDCLTLDVWTPRAAAEERRPVMVWIHGGSFTTGSGAIYDSRRLATRGDIVVVTINYRLGALGFLAHPSLGPPGAVGNYGLADQQAALRWVRDNIAAFGGDPARVTIAGESAGAIAVCDHLVAPGSTGLFRAAIIQSGPCQAQVGLPAAEAASVDYAAKVGCGDPATAATCLRAIPADKLRTAVEYFGIGDEKLSGPVTGTAALPIDPVTAIANGAAARVPIVIGTNRDEFTFFVALRYLSGIAYGDADYPRLLSDAFGPNADAVAARYPLTNYGGSASLTFAAAVTDGAFACVADRLGNELASTNPVYAYEFNDPHAAGPDSLGAFPFPLGASHTLELRYLFDVEGVPPLTPEQTVLSDQMIDYWSRFVAAGDPAVGGQPAWPTLNGGRGENRLSLEPDGSRLITDFDDTHQCEFWASLEG